MKKKQKLVSIKELVRRALKNKPKWKPRKGYVYLAKIKSGEMFETEFGTTGIHLKSSEGLSSVIVIEQPSAKTEEDKRYYLGKQNWSPKTEVRRIK